VPDPVTKTCKKCGKVKSFSEFHRDKRRTDGYRDECRACGTARRNHYRKTHRKAAALADRKYKQAMRQRDRAEVFAHYGTSCACCGATENLTIDHVNGGGNAHRRELGGGGVNFYRWLVKQELPPGYQTLCRPCNRSKSERERCALRHNP
jgi:hypothetical protein